MHKEAFCQHLSDKAQACQQTEIYLGYGKVPQLALLRQKSVKTVPLYNYDNTQTKFVQDSHI